MVLDFTLIPNHIKINIAEKIEFWDFKQLELSSDHGMQIANSLRHKPVLYVHKIGMNTSQIRFFIKSSDGKFTIKKDWKSIRTFAGLPRFSVKFIETWPTVSVENLVHLKQDAIFIPDKVHVLWRQQGRTAKEIFQLLSEIFNISHFQSFPFLDDPEIISMPLFQQLDVISHPVDSIPDDVFLNLKAHTIEQNQLSSSPAVGPTLNQFFHQWFNKEREIRNLYIWADHCHPSNQPDVLFSGLPLSLLWNAKTHDSSIISSMPLEKMQPAALTDNVYMIDRGDKKLLVFVDFEILLAEETTDVRSTLMNSLSNKE